MEKELELEKIKDVLFYLGDLIAEIQPESYDMFVMKDLIKEKICKMLGEKFIK